MNSLRIAGARIRCYSLFSAAVLVLCLTACFFHSSVAWAQSLFQ